MVAVSCHIRNVTVSEKWLLVVVFEIPLTVIGDRQMCSKCDWQWVVTVSCCVQNSIDGLWRPSLVVFRIWLTVSNDGQVWCSNGDSPMHDDFQERTSWSMTGFILASPPRWRSQDCTLCSWPPPVTVSTTTATVVSCHNLGQHSHGSTCHVYILPLLLPSLEEIRKKDGC